MPILQSTTDPSGSQTLLGSISIALRRWWRNATDKTRDLSPFSGPATACASETTRRLADGAARLARLHHERERLGDAGIGRPLEDRIVWTELIDLELQEIDEQVSRLSQAAEGGEPGKADPSARRALMNTTTHRPLDLTNEEFAVLAELLQSERAKLLIEIRHTHHRVFREELRHRLTLVEDLLEHCGRA